MEESEIIRLKNEVSRLNQIITVLLDQNEYLKAQLGLPGNGNASPKLGYSVAENSKGTTGLGNSFPEKKNGTTEQSYSNTEKENGTTELGNSFTENSNGTTMHGYSIAENGSGITEVWRPLPVSITIDNISITRLYVKLKANGFNKVSRKGIRNTATLLLHFYNKGAGDHATLRKLTSLSKGGLAKLIMSLKKRGLIYRTGYQQFAVIGSGLYLLKETFAEKAKP